MNAVFLSGGGARSAYEVGVLKALLSDGPPIQLIGGTSVGAINAVIVATGQLDELAAVWQHMSALKMYRPRLDFWNFPKWTSILDNKKLFSHIHEQVQWGKLIQTDLQVFIHATNISLRTNEVFTNTEITYQHVMAASAVPVLFPPVQIGKHWYIDGAFSMPQPLQPLIDAGANRIFTIFSSPRRPRMEPPNNIFNMANSALEVILSSSLSSAREQIESNNTTIERVKVIGIYPSRDLGKVGSYLKVSKDQAREMMELGMTDCYRVLKNHDLLGR
jgi:NTE family protein